jgi:hypothetical protein
LELYEDYKDSRFRQKSQTAGLTYKTTAQMLFVKAIGGHGALDSVHIANYFRIT